MYRSTSFVIRAGGEVGTPARRDRRGAIGDAGETLSGA